MQDEKKRYCICRSSDINGFMICCEKCDEWYHGKCIGLAEKDAKFINKWYCSVCINTCHLEIEYTTRNKSLKKSKKTLSHKTKNKEDSLNTQNGGCGKCSNCLQDIECGNKDYFSIANNSDRNELEKLSHSQHTAGSSWEPKQCYGPQCQNGVRPNSKYCSDACGLALAKYRIMQILPQRIMERNQYPCVADQLDQARLDNVRIEQQKTRDELKKLDRIEMKLEQLIAKTKQLPIIESPDLPVEDSKIYCVSCGWDISVRSANRHMEICFKKYESQTTIASTKRTYEGNILCEYYDKGNKTYCKRLRYICPDHYKPKRVKENEVCGCPIVDVISSNITLKAKQYCQQPKLTCDHHYNWEVLQLSQIDLEKYRQIYKLDELLEEEMAIKRRMTNRNGVLGLLLHSTTVHDSSA